VDNKNIDAEVEAWDTRFDELDAILAAARDRGDARAVGDALVDIAVHLLAAALTDDAIDVMISARDAFLELPNPPVEATECAFWVGNLAMMIGDPETARDGYRMAADEYEARGMHGEATENYNNYGVAATQLGAYADAERALDRAIAGYRRLRMPDEIPGVRLNLANVHRLSARRELAEREYLAIRTELRSGSADSAKCTASLAALYTEQERAAEARREFTRAIDEFRRLGNETDVLECESSLAQVDLLENQPHAAAARMGRVRARFETLDRPDKVTVCDYNLANFYAAAGYFTAADAAFTAARAGLIEAGLEHQLPNLEWNRFRRLLLEGATLDETATAPVVRAALDTAVASLIGTDQQRFQFPDTQRRVAWRELFTARLSSVFELAFQLGEAELVADLIESGLNAGVYGTPAPSDGAGLAEFDGRPAGPPTVPSTPDSDDPDGGPLSLGAAALLATAELPLAPPPSLSVGPGGREVLGRYRALAASDNPALTELLRTSRRVSIF
jgi:tetratricopeptide (TPR) repeat protein